MKKRKRELYISSTLFLSVFLFHPGPLFFLFFFLNHCCPHSNPTHPQSSKSVVGQSNPTTTTTTIMAEAEKIAYSSARDLSDPESASPHPNDTKEAHTQDAGHGEIADFEEKHILKYDQGTPNKRRERHCLIDGR